jgi:hypothetical protein
VPSLVIRPDGPQKIRRRCGVVRDQDVAERIGVDPDEVGRVLSGEHPPGNEFIAGVIDRCGIAFAFDHIFQLVLSNGSSLVTTEAPDERYPLPVATQMILGDNHGLADPERWVAKQLRAGRFRGQKIGRQWFMRGEDIEAASTPAPAPAPAADKARRHDPTDVEPHSIIGGMSARGARRLIHHQPGW